jgi:adenosylhomocysteine nucleosidase
VAIAILSALPEEQAGLLALLQSPLRSVRAGREFWQGTVHGHALVLALSRIGKVAAATTATLLIEHFGVSAIVFTGVAGGLASQVRVGDVVVGTQYLQHDMDASPLFARYEVPLYGLQRFNVDPALHAQLATAANTLAVSLRPSQQIQVHQGLILSGDRFVSSAAEVTALRSALPDGLCVEMEGAAVAQVCWDYQVPFAAVRTISDRADDSAHIDFPLFVRDVAGPYAVQCISTWLEQLPS